MSTSVQWVTFGENSKQIKTSIHFFPYAGSISATYPVELSITIFGADIETLQVTMEGARLSQPDGLIIDQVFPALLSDYKGLYGIAVKVSCEQQSHLDLSYSTCMTEIMTPDDTIKFPAKMIKEDKEVLSGICHCNQKDMTKIIGINFSDQEMASGFPAGLVNTKFKQSNALDPYSVNEFSCSNDYVQSGASYSTEDQSHYCQTFEVKPQNNNLVYFTIDRSSDKAYPVAANPL